MENQTPANAPARHWPLFLVGVLLFVSGPVLYFVQLRLQNLGMPWYVPALSTAGVLCMSISVMQRRGILRSVGLLLFVVLCGFEWLILLTATKSPPYAGPAQPGRKVSEFAAMYADGTAFSHNDLEDGHRSVLVFFRGRW